MGGGTYHRVIGGSAKPLAFRPGFKPRLSKVKVASKSRKARKGYKVSTPGSFNQTIGWRGSPFPRELTTQLTYSDTVTLTATTGVPNHYLYSTNNLYDCNVTGTGHQPRFFDTLCTNNASTGPYKNWRVYASKISLEIMPSGSTSDTMGMRSQVGIGFFNTTATAPSTVGEMRERSDYTSRYLGYWSSTQGVVKMSRFGSNKILFGIKDIKDDDNIVGDNNAGPSKEGRWAITCAPLDEASTVSYRINVRITYYVMFFNRNDVADS